MLVLNSNFLQGKVLISAEKLLIVADNDDNVLVLNSNFLQGKVLISAEKLLIVADNDGRKLENVEKLLKNDGRIGKR